MFKVSSILVVWIQHLKGEKTGAARKKGKKIMLIKNIITYALIAWRNRITFKLCLSSRSCKIRKDDQQ